MRLVAFDRCAAGQSGRSAHGAAIVVRPGRKFHIVAVEVGEAVHPVN